MRLFVGNLSQTTNAIDLGKLFETIGPVFAFSSFLVRLIVLLQQKCYYNDQKRKL